MPQNDLLDIYQYYCRIGMGLSSPSLRAASLGMLAVLAENNADAVARDVTRLAALRSDPWWEVQAQVAVVCSVLMSVLGADDATAQAACRVCSSMLGAGPPPAATRVAVAHVAKVRPTATCRAWWHLADVCLIAHTALAAEPERLPGARDAVRCRAALASGWCSREPAASGQQR